MKLFWILLILMLFICTKIISIITLPIILIVSCFVVLLSICYKLMSRPKEMSMLKKIKNLLETNEKLEALIKFLGLNSKEVPKHWEFSKKNEE